MYFYERGETNRLPRDVAVVLPWEVSRSSRMGNGKEHGMDENIKFKPFKLS